MRYATLIAALILVQGQCLADLDDDTLARAAAHYEAMIYATVSSRMAEDIDKAQLTDDQANEWLDAIVGKLATCHLEALVYLGPSVRDETLTAFASGASNQTISQIISRHMKSDANFQATLATYSDVRNQCTVLINQEFGISYY